MVNRKVKAKEGIVCGCGDASGSFDRLTNIARGERCICTVRDAKTGGFKKKKMGRGLVEKQFAFIQFGKDGSIE